MNYPVETDEHGNAIPPIDVPKCPKCGNPLYSIGFQETGGYSLIEDEGTYEDNEQSTTLWFCGECGEEIGGYRSDGYRWGFQPQIE